MARERGIDAARHEQLRKAHGLDQPVSVQYGISIGALRGDLGKSMITQAPVVQEFAALRPPDVPLDASGAARSSRHRARAEALASTR